MKTNHIAKVVLVAAGLGASLVACDGGHTHHTTVVNHTTVVHQQPAVTHQHVTVKVKKH